ncbi:MAG: hypothetical protein ACRD12_07055 [Acidimicrobiales bacterium]
MGTPYPLRRLAALALPLVVVVVAPACAGGSGTGVAPTTVPRPTTTAGDTKVTAATAVVEPDSIGGIPLGATRQEAIEVFGPPDSTAEDQLRWQFGGGTARGLTLFFRSGSTFSPGLTDWIATARGPVTAKGVGVGDGAGAVIAAYGALDPFCCETKVASVEQAGGRMIVVVGSYGTSAVGQVIGGDPKAWSRSIAD